MEKSCSKCKSIKPYSDFGKDPKMDSGHRSQCKKCVTESAKARYASKPISERREAWKRNDKRPRLYNSSKNKAIAKAKGELRYDGKPCPHCGGKDRYVSSGSCANCRLGPRGRIKHCTPPWADDTAIRKFYANCPQGHEVDHIMPLKAKYASGLHVIENLQYLPKWLNRLKGNKMLDEKLIEPFT